MFAQLERAWVCIDASSLERFEAFAASEGASIDAAGLRARAVVAGALEVDGAPGQAHPAEPDRLAFIQYSSGSTGDPKGVLLTHRNLCANIASIIEAGEYSDRDVTLSWMPLSHDMGLIGFHLNMLASGASHAIMRTELFARRPLLWLELASRMGATVLCSPNFGYQHYLKQYELKPQAAARPVGGAPDLQRRRADLGRSLPPLHADAGRARPQAGRDVHGLRPGRGQPRGQLPAPRRAARDPASRPGARCASASRCASPNRRPTRSASSSSSAGRCPAPRSGSSTTAALPCADGVLGHIEIRGENVTAGYYRGSAAPAAEPPADGWLDTGDLGLLSDGQLVVTGRAKDLVIVNGQNFYPHDFERVAQQVADVDANRVAAAGVRLADEQGGEGLALFVLHRGELEGFVAKARGIRRAIAEQTGVEVAAIVPVAQIPKTTSGKLQRYLLARSFEQGEFAPVLARLAPLLAPADPGQGGRSEPGSTLGRLQAICQRVVPDRQIAPDDNLLEINLNSLALARLHEAIDREFPHRIEVSDLFEYPTLALLARFLDAPSA